MRIFITGGSGMLGHCLMRAAAPKHEVWGTYHSHPVELPFGAMMTLDVTNEDAVRDLFETIRPDAVIHTAALTDVDECERNPEKARAINSEGTAITAKSAEAIGAGYVYISTDYVFDGIGGAFDESRTPRPVNHYGASKFLGEQLAVQNSSRALTIRTTIFGLKLSPLLGMMENMVEALREGKPMTRFVDQYFTPLYTADLSDVILLLAENRARGTYHVGAVDKVSRYEFTKQVAEVFALDDGAILSGKFHQLDGLARRPQDTSLISQRVVGRLGIKLPSVKEGLRRLQRDWRESKQEGRVAH